LSSFRQIKIVSIFIFLVLSPLASAYAAPVAIGDLSPAQVLQVAENFIANGRASDAVAMSKAWHPENPWHKSLQAFVQARIVEKQGDSVSAIQAYRAILVLEPRFRPARVALARALTRTGNDEAAKFQLENLLSASSGGASDNELKQMLSTIESRKPFKFGFYASLLPSTNINTGTDNTTVLLNGIPFTINERRKTGFGLIAGGWATYNQSFTPTKTFLAYASLDHRFYPTLKAHLTSVNFSVGIAHQVELFKVTGTLIAGGEFNDFKSSSNYIGARLEASRNLGGGWSVKSLSEVKYQQFETSHLKNGWLYTGRVTVDKAISASRFYRGFVGAEFNRAEAIRFSYSEALVGVGGYNEFGAGVSIYAEVSAAKRKYKAIGLGLNSERFDTRLQARSVFTKRDFNIFGLAPQLGYTFTRNISNSVFDDYTKHDFDVRLTKAF
jgi:outer membrane protein